MPGWRSTLATLLLSYVGGVLATRWLILGAFALNAPTIAGMLAVPLVQAAAWIGWRRASDPGVMTRVFKYWTGFALLAAVTSDATAYLAFRYVDLSFAHFATLVSAPLLQAVVMTWRIARPADALASLGWRVARQSLAQPVLWLDGAMLAVGVFAWDAHLAGFGAPVTVQSIWTLVKSGAAIAFCASAVLRSHGPRRRALVRGFAAPLLLMLALEPSTSWLAATFAFVHDAVGPSAEVLQRIAFYGVTFALLVGLTLRSARAMRTWSHEAGQLIELSTAAAAALALAVILATFNLPILTQPWLGAATLSASCASSAMLLAAIGLVSAGRTNGE